MSNAREVIGTLLAALGTAVERYAMIAPDIHGEDLDESDLEPDDEDDDPDAQLRSEIAEIELAIKAGTSFLQEQQS